MAILPQEPYYDPATPTIALGAVLVSAAEPRDDHPAWLPANPWPLCLAGLIVFALALAGIVWRGSLYAAGFSAGWAARELAGTVWSNRGWGALVVIAIVVAAVIVAGRNRTYTYPEQPWYVRSE